MVEKKIEGTLKKTFIILLLNHSVPPVSLNSSSGDKIGAVGPADLYKINSRKGSVAGLSGVPLP